MEEKKSLTDVILKNLQWIVVGLILMGIGAWVGYVLDATASPKHGLQPMKALNAATEYLNANDIVASQLAVFKFGTSFYGWLIGGVVGLLVFGYFTVGNEDKRYHRKGVEHGSARWGNNNEKRIISDVNDFYNNAILASDVMLVIDRKKRDENAMPELKRKKLQAEKELAKDIEHSRCETISETLKVFLKQYENSDECFIVKDGILVRFNESYDDKKITIPDYVTGIGEFAFAETSVVEVNAVNAKTIGFGAFYGCSKLKAVLCEEAVHIEESAFEKCMYLYDVKFSKKLKSIEKNAFARSLNVMFNVPDNELTYAEKYANENGIFTVKYTDGTGKQKKLTTTEVINKNHKAAKIKPMLNLNMLILGGSGTGKSRFFVTPNLCQCNTSFVVTDPSGELLRACGKMLQRNGYDVKVFNLENMEHSSNYNPFNYLYEANSKGERKYNENYVIKMIQVFMDNTKGEGGNGGDPFWDNATKMLLSACCFYLMETAPPEKQNFAEVLNLIHKAAVDENASKDEKSEFDCIFELRRQEDENALSVQFYDEFNQAAGKTMQSILISTTTRLQLFKLEQVKNLTWCDNINLEQIGDRKTALFIIIPSTNATYNFLAAMMYTQLFDTLYSRAINVHGGRLPVHVRFILDEFANGVTRSVLKRYGT